MNSTVKGISLNCDGAHVRGLLRENAASAQAAREMAAAVRQIEAEYDVATEWGQMTFSRRGGSGADYCMVEGHITDAGELTVKVRVISDWCHLPRRAFETVCLARCVRNRDARLAAEAAAREAEAAQGAPQ